MATESYIETENLLRFLYQTPYGVISANMAGRIDLMNAFATQLLMPLAAEANFTQLYSILAIVETSLIDTIKQFPQDSGVICQNERLSFEQPDGITVWLDVTIIKLSADALMLGLMDSTPLVDRENAACVEAEKRAEGAARLEMATGVIHDIGNAITAVGVNAAKLVAADNWPEIPNLRRIRELVDHHRTGIDSALGAGKGQALADFICSIEKALRGRQQEQVASAAAIAKSVHHIQDIIRIQKQFAKDGHGAALLPVDINEIFHHAKSILENLLLKCGITLSLQHEGGPLTVTGDKTRLTQVLVNLLKNACESIASRAETNYRGQITVSAIAQADAVLLAIRDNGIGFDEETGSKLNAAEVFSSKAEGSGVGLSSSRSVVKSHGGRLEISSAGSNQGCLVELYLPAPAGSNSQ